MTNEEAKANLEKLLLLYDDGMIDFSEIRESVKTAIEVLEKQIPKKPKIPLDAYWVCPMCGIKVEYIYSHCRSCGQAIDWSDKG